VTRRGRDRQTRLTRGIRLAVLGVVVLCVGSSTVAVEGDPSVVGQWSLAQTLPFFPVHVSMLPTDRVMIWPGDQGISGNNPREWDPANPGAPTSPLTPPGYDVFCSGHSFLANGGLLVTGGHIQNGVGLANASIYDPFADAWTPVPDMNAGRWYPTNTTLANGDVLVVSGDVDGTVGVNRLPQVYQVASGTWRDLTSAQLALPLYPMMHVAPNGKVFNPGPSQTTRYLDTSGAGAWTVVANRNFGSRSYGSSVMYADGKVLVMGGGDPPTNTAEVIDLNAPTPTWRNVASMATARRQLNATLLPDGKVLVTGGTSGPGFNNADFPVYEAEMWDPATEGWTRLASSDPRFKRLYHSAATLLPDGRVLITGGNGYPEAEIFSPPYLFRGAPPTITSAPASVTYGQTFFVETPDAASITQVTWIRLTSVTHAFNQNQRINHLSFSQAAGGLNVVAPSGPNLAPVGHYLLFILNGNGVPAVAKIVQITQAGGPGPNGLVAAYGFNEASGPTVVDASGNNNTGTLGSGVTRTAAGRFGGALVFNGGGFVTVPNAASLQLTTGMTLEAWVNPSTVTSAWRDVIYKGNDNYYLEATSVTAGRPGAGGTFGTTYGTAALTANGWTHLAVTYDRVAVRLYVNGVQVSSLAATAAIATSTNPLQIGGDSIYGQYFQGTIDEVRVYNRALTAVEIQGDMNTPVGSSSQPTLSIANATVTEGNTGTVSAQFTVSLSAAATQTVTVQYATADGTATAGSD
jgi:Concanavalin A-like lectin/glucanases superfamily/Domain of unknown function (DUF1929)/Kelch motif